MAAVQTDADATKDVAITGDVAMVVATMIADAEICGNHDCGNHDCGCPAEQPSRPMPPPPPPRPPRPPFEDCGCDR